MLHSGPNGANAADRAMARQLAEAAAKAKSEYRDQISLLTTER